MPPAAHALWAEVGGGIILVPSGRDCCATHKTAGYLCETGGSFKGGKPQMQALVGQPSLHGYDTCMVYCVKGALCRICRQKHGKTSFFSFQGFLCSRNSRFRFWGLILWHLWIGRARHPGPALPYHQVGLEVFIVGGWLTHGDLALEAGFGFLAVAEHRFDSYQGFGVSGPGSRARGCLPVKIPLMLVMMVLSA